ncbi:hypothetical protein VTN00DRAFT_2055 [Thermoascus crustaceus]|uniref:uncharacterized protein n=1 Tax=Thermoascus crustaceus TaxID=5088 RepID=UPI0037423477
MDTGVRIVARQPTPIAGLPRLTTNSEVATMEYNFHKRNIYVSPDDPTIITGIVDWQSTSIEPAFVYANETPDFAAPPEEDMLNDEDKLKTYEAKGRVKDASICYQTYDVCMKGFVPKLPAARLLDPTLFRLFHYQVIRHGGTVPQLSDRS